MAQSKVITPLSSSLIAPLLLVALSNNIFVAAESTDYTCYYERDYQFNNKCNTIQDKVCDDPNHGGNGGEECRNQDCLDCNYHCRQFDADCHGCMNAHGCFYCPGDGTCENSSGYRSVNKIQTCNEESDYLSSLLGHTPESCVADDAYTKDPLYGGSQWAFEMINVIDVWETYGLTGKGVNIRINDDGVYVDNKEFEGRFDALENSCSEHLPIMDAPGEVNDHGTAVAGIIVGNANNNLCSAGIASGAKFSSCNFFAEGMTYGALAYKIETFDISQNSIGMPGCVENGVVPEEDNIIYDAGCPFTKKDSDYSPCDFCYGEFTASARSFSVDCVEAITNHCKYYYKEDTEACLDFPELVIGGSCDYDKVPASAYTAIELGIREGRDGKGTIFTFAAGNSFKEGDDVNFSGWTNSRYTISVGAVGKDGLHAAYSSPGAALVVSAPAGDDKDIGHLLTVGLGVDTCADSGLGTSFACPVVTGVIALMLEANPNLSWRDVQGIFAETSTNVEDSIDNTQTTNGAGLWHSSWYGFGIVNAMAAVEAAMEWNPYHEELQAIGISAEENKQLADNEGNQFTSTIDLDPADDNYPDDFVAESTVVLIDLSHYNRGDLEIELESPSGTKSVLHPGRRPENSQLQEEERWKMMTVKNWGEDPTGKWKLTIRDLVDRENSTDQNVFRNWQIIVYGRSASGKDGFGGGDVVEDDGPPRSEACLNPDKPTPGCSLDLSGDQVCPIAFTLTGGGTTVTLDSKIICPNDVVSDGNLDITEATQRGLCSCEVGLFDEDCDVIEADLECQCFECPAGGMAFGCNKEIIGNCKSLDCDGTCNGEFEFPLGAGNTPEPTKSPTKKPTVAPTKNPTKNPTKTPTTTPTFNPTKKPTENPTKQEISVSPTTIAGQITDEDLINDEKGEEDENEGESPDLPDTVVDEANLSCPEAVPISSTTPPVDGIISSLPLVGFEGECLSGLETVGGWYQVTGNGNVFTLTACSLKSSRSVQISVFGGNCNQAKCIENQSRQIAACGDGNGHSTSFATQAGTSYNVLISGIPIGAPLPGALSGATSEKEVRHLESMSIDEIDFQLEVTESETPNNSKCDSARPANFNKAVKGDTKGLTTTSKTCQNRDKQGVWYTVEGTRSKQLDGVIVYEANTCNQESNFFNTMSVFRGESCGDKECVDVDILPCPSGWFGQQVYWSSTVKENYQIFVHSDDSIEAQTYSAGTFQMDLRQFERLPNDQCNAALPVELNRVEPVKSTTTGAKPDMFAIENSSCGAGGAGAWYKTTGTGGIMQASTCSDETDHKTSIQVYAGRCGNLECVDYAGGNKALCGDGRGSVVNFRTELGKDYYILVAGRREGQTGNFRLQVMEEDAVANDQCRSGPSLTKDVTINGSTLQATVDFPPNESCVVPLESPGVWYTIEGAGKAIEVTTCQNNEFDSAISVFGGTCPMALECVTGSSAVDPKCTTGKGVTTSFFGEKNTKYQVYVHGAAGSPNYMGDFSLTYTEFTVTEQHEFCPTARKIPTDGTRIQGSTEDSTGASIPAASCGVDITQPGLWYTFSGNGQSFELLACSEDEGDFDVSISVFEGGPGGCDALTCLSGTTFVETCSSIRGRRSLQPTLSDFRLMSKPGTEYYVFVHGTDVGDFSMFVTDENIDGFGTAAPTETPMKHGRDLFRWIPVDANILVIPTDYLDLTIIDEPLQGTANITGYEITYTPLEDFVGDDIIRLEGCNDGDCYRFEVTIHIMGEKVDLTAAAGKNGNSKMWLWLLLLIPLIPAICFPFYMFYKKKNKNWEGDSDEDEDLSLDDFDHDPFSRDKKGLLSNERSSRRGMNDSSGDDWESSDDDDEDFEGSYDSDADSSDDDDSSRQTDDSADGFGSDFNDEQSGSSGYSNRFT